MTPTMMRAGTKTNVIPDRVELEVDIRALPGWDTGDVRGMLVDVLGDMADDVEIAFQSEEPASTSPIDTPLWTRSNGSAKSSTPGPERCPSSPSGPPMPGTHAPLGSVSYGFGLHSPAIGFEQYGAMFHGIDERVDVESLRLSTEMWMALARDFPGLTRTIGRAGWGRLCSPPLQRKWISRPPDQQVLELEPVQCGAAGGRAGRFGPADMAQDVGTAQQPVEPAVDEVPGAHVLGLLLQPHHLLRRRVTPQHLGDLVFRPRVELLDPDYGDMGSGVTELIAPADGIEGHLPEQSTTRLTPARSSPSEAAGSSTTSSKEPDVKAAIGERAWRARRRDFGVNTMSGLRSGTRTWARSTWKYSAAVVGLQPEIPPGTE